MNRALWRVWMAMCCGWLLALASDAAIAVTTTFCFQYSTSFTDAAVGDYLTGSYTEALGARVKFVRESDDVVVDDVIVDDYTGCITLDGNNGTTKLDSSEDYTVKVLREALIHSNHIELTNSSGSIYTVIAKTGFSPYSFTWTYSHAGGATWTRIGSSDRTNIMAAATWALGRDYSGIYFAIWNAADPDTWTASGDLSGTTTGYPLERILTAQGGTAYPLMLQQGVYRRSRWPCSVAPQNPRLRLPSPRSGRNRSARNSDPAGLRSQRTSGPVAQWGGGRDTNSKRVASRALSAIAE